MSYVNDITTSLTRVLSHACDGPPERFAGYAANRYFWVEEALHYLEVINGYKDRFDQMKWASEASRRPQSDWPTLPIFEPSMTAQDLSDARRSVKDAMERFLRRCLKTDQYHLQEDIVNNAGRLGITLKR